MKKCNRIKSEHFEIDAAQVKRGSKFLTLLQNNPKDVNMVDTEVSTMDFCRLSIELSFELLLATFRDDPNISKYPFIHRTPGAFLGFLAITPSCTHWEKATPKKLQKLHEKAPQTHC